MKGALPPPRGKVSKVINSLPLGTRLIIIFSASFPLRGLVYGGNGKNPGKLQYQRKWINMINRMRKNLIRFPHTPWNVLVGLT